MLVQWDKMGVFCGLPMRTSKFINLTDFTSILVPTVKFGFGTAEGSCGNLM